MMIKNLTKSQQFVKTGSFQMSGGKNVKPKTRVPFRFKRFVPTNRLRFHVNI